jgi:membrane fusion protein (multidrug efflux system)
LTGYSRSDRRRINQPINYFVHPGLSSAHLNGQEIRTKMPVRLPSDTFLATGLAVFLLSGCGRSNSIVSAAPPPPPVSVVEVEPQTVPIFGEYAAQTFARDAVEIRGQVDGYIRKRLFKTGADVKVGDVLYVLDLRPYEADVAKAGGDVAQSEANTEFAQKQVSLLQAQADLAQAEANELKARQDVDRLTPLVKADAASQQDLDAAVAQFNANKANVAARKANVEQTRLSTRNQIAVSNAQLIANQALLSTARLNLEYATIVAPVSGRIGDSLLQVGGLVTKNSVQPLTTLTPLDPIWVRFKVSESDYLTFLKHTGADDLRHSPLELLLADGSIFPQRGRVEDASNQVDPKTGTLEMQAIFPNPKHELLPGQFGRIRVQIRERRDVLLVPQRAITELQGSQSVLTVGSGDKAEARAVVLGDRSGTAWIVEQGLKPGDRVIVDGLMTMGPGSPVRPQLYHPELAESPRQSGGK